MRRKIYRIGGSILCGVLLSMGAVQAGATEAPQEVKAHVQIRHELMIGFQNRVTILAKKGL